MAGLVICLLLAVSFVQGHHEKYENHQLYRVVGPSQKFAELELYLDFLSINSASKSNYDQIEVLVRLSPEVKEKWLKYFEESNMKYKKVAGDLADILRDEEAKIKESKIAAKFNGTSMSWDTYYRHNEMNTYIDYLGKQYPELVTVVDAGLSYEGRLIKYVKISSNSFKDSSKPVIVLDAAVHAREWITPPVAFYIIHNLVIDIVDRQLTEKVDWIIIPMANPDGYEYSFDVDRLWRKTRSKSHEGAEECPGVDGNRNFDHYFGTREPSADPCSIIFEGPAPFSEPETQIIRDAVLEHLDRTALYISIHSFGNMFLYAWGNNGSLPTNALQLHVAGVRMATEIDKLKIDKAPLYVVGNAAKVLYFTSGTSRDWTRAVGVPLTYTLELPGYEYEFEVPPKYIEQIVTETWAGIAAGAHYVLSQHK